MEEDWTLEMTLNPFSPSKIGTNDATGKAEIEGSRAW
jgi:hypothetical protein